MKSKLIILMTFLVLTLPSFPAFGQTQPAAEKTQSATEKTHPVADKDQPATDKTQPAAGPTSFVPDAQQRAVSPDEAFALFAAAAEKGQPEAMLSLGACYERGVGVTRNFSKAKEWYQKAAEAGLSAGFYNLGVCYEVGMGTEANQAEAVKNFEKAAELKLPTAFYKMANINMHGSGIPKNEAKAVDFLVKAAETGHSVAANDLGVIYIQGLMQQPKNEKKAFEMFLKSADNGNAEAMKNIAVIFQDGMGQPKNPGQTLKWYILAKSFGYDTEDLGKALEDTRAALKPKQVEAAEAEAAKWLNDFKEKMAAQEGEAVSQAKQQAK